jgi:hypothetical protein
MLIASSLTPLALQDMLGKMVLSVCDELGHVQLLEYGTTSGTDRWAMGSSIVSSAGDSNE